tara:strand:- start:71 stop:2023 length:1953 start_codon:yes stop_codon:yes gene_type:complete
MSAANKLLQAASGGAKDDPVYVDDVFQTFLYNGDTSATSRTLTTGMDFTDRGGLAWFKRRSNQGDSQIYDTERNNLKYLVTNRSNAEAAQGSPSSLISFNSNGVTVGQNSPVNANGEKICLWQFLKQAGFFDIVTYTGDNSSNRQIAHDLQCVPSMIWVKRTDSGDSWYVYHVGNGHTNPEDYYLELNGTGTRVNNDNYWNDTAPTATHFTIGGAGGVNQGGGTFVAYLFAGTGDSASQIFGADGDEAIIKSGFFEYTSSGQDIDLGFEPQWIIYKNASGSSTSYWGIADVMRGLSHQPNSTSKYLRTNANDAEGNNGIFRLLHNGFRNTGGFGSGDRIVYTAIAKRHKPADYGTDYFGLTAYTGNDTSVRTFEFGPTQFDWHVNTRTDGNSDVKTSFRSFHRATSTSAQQLGSVKLNATNTDNSADFTMDHTGGITTTTKGTLNGEDDYYQAAWMRRPGLLDIVAYEGNGSARTISHQLDAVPEMMLIKSRTSTRPFVVYHSGIGNDKFLNITNTDAATSAAVFNNTTPTSSVFSVGAQNSSNENGKYFVALLYASSAGIQKVGSFTKSGNTAVDCGFAAHPRWIMLKRYDSTGDWYVFYAFNNGGNDTYYLWNSNQPSVTNQNYIENYAGGFQVEGLDDGDYIFMAIA